MARPPRWGTDAVAVAGQRLLEHEQTSKQERPREPERRCAYIRRHPNSASWPRPIERQGRDRHVHEMGMPPVAINERPRRSICSRAGGACRIHNDEEPIRDVAPHQHGEAGLARHQLRPHPHVPFLLGCPRCTRHRGRWFWMLRGSLRPCDGQLFHPCRVARCSHLELRRPAAPLPL